MMELTRGQVPIKQYGLPDKREFPLITMEDVKNAARYFRLSEKNDRVRLADAINRRATELGIKFSEKEMDSFNFWVKDTLVTDKGKNNIENVSATLNDVFCLRDDMKTYTLDNPLSSQFKDTIDRVSSRYIMYREGNNYIEGVMNNQALFYFHMCTDIMDGITRIIETDGVTPMLGTWVESFKIAITLFKEHERSAPIENVYTKYCGFYIYHKIAETSKVEAQQYEYMKELYEYISKNYDDVRNMNPDAFVKETFYITSGLPKTTIYLDNESHLLKRELDIILTDVSLSKRPTANNILPYRQAISHVKICDELPESGLLDLVSYLERLEQIIDISDLEDAVRDIDCTVKLTEVAEVVLRRLQKKFISVFYIWSYSCNCPIFFALKEDGLYGITCSKDSSQLYLNKIKEGITDRVTVTKVYRITTSVTNKQTNMLEGLTIEEDGTVKIELTHKTNLMDEYASNHRMIVEALKNANYNEMKLILAYDFALIDRIEHELNSKKSITSKRKEELVKARQFLMNDFKTYLKEVMKSEPRFNFTEYYNSCDEIKSFFVLDAKTINGIKALFRNILL